MEIKKSPKADLEGGKTLSILMGLVLAIACLYVGFEWGTYDIKAVSASEGVGDILAEEEIDITLPEDVPPPPPPPPPVQIIEELNIVDDDVVLESQEIFSIDDDLNTAQTEVYTPPSDGEEEVADENQIFVVVENPPEFPGGETALMKYLSENIKYPPLAAENGIEGRVTITFVVNKDGSIVDATVLRGVDPALDKEALRVVKAMPNWTPGKQLGKPVRVSFRVPVTFRLR